MSRIPVALAALVTTLALAAPPAGAVSTTVQDPSGDASGAIDIRKATFDNGAGKLVVKVAFDEVVGKRGVYVSVEPRGGVQGVSLLSGRRPGKEDRNLVIDGAADQIASGTGRLDCPGFRSRWNVAKATVKLTLPSDCLAGGAYGALRFVVLAEGSSGDDSDFVPQQGPATDELRPTGWIARG